MAKYISINVVGNETSGLAGASALNNGTYLIPTDKIIIVSQTAANVAAGLVKIIMDTAIGTLDTYTVAASTSASLGQAASLPANTEGRLLAKAIQYAMSANPGGVISNVSPGNDQAAIPVRCYWRACALGGA